MAVIGASTESHFSHNAWFSDRETFPKEITHPVIADTNHSVQALQSGGMCGADWKKGESFVA